MTSTLRMMTNVFLTSMMLLWPMRAAAQEPFFKGKTVRIVVGFAAGGGAMQITNSKFQIPKFATAMAGWFEL